MVRGSTMFNTTFGSDGQPDEVQLFSRLSLDSDDADFFSVGGSGVGTESDGENDGNDGNDGNDDGSSAAAGGVGRSGELPGPSPQPLAASLKALIESGFFSKLAESTASGCDDSGTCWYSPMPAPAPASCFAVDSREPHLVEGQPLLRTPSLDGSVTCVA